MVKVLALVDNVCSCMIQLLSTAFEQKHRPIRIFSSQQKCLQRPPISNKYKKNQENIV